MDSTWKQAVKGIGKYIMPRIPCPDSQTLESLLSGRLPYPQLERLAQHLEGCSDCSHKAAQLSIDDALVSTLSSSVAVAPDPDQSRINNLIQTLCRNKSFVSFSEKDGTSLNSLWEVKNALLAHNRIEALGQIGSYSVQTRLGAGGMGEVYLARQKRPDRAVALKIFRARTRKEGERLVRFEAEAEVAARLRHPNIVQVYEAGEQGEIAFIAMELVEGESLAARLARAVLTPRESTILLSRLARAVHFAHVNGVVHRDLKPSNILLECDGTPKLSDFGLAKDMGNDCGNQTQTGELLGTPAYMAPEQASDGKSVGPATDIYGLGAILYECLTGRPPFKGTSVLATLDQIRAQEPIPPGRLQQGIPRDLQTICLKCLEKAPDKRYSSASDLAEDLDRFLHGDPIKARPIGLARRGMKWARRRPTIAGLSAISCLLTLAVGSLVAIYTARLHTEVERANTNADAARHQHNRAMANYTMARETIRKILGRLTELRTGEIPRLRELQRSQMEDALVYFEGVLGGLDDSDPEIKLDAAVAESEAGIIHFTMGQRDKAEADFLRAAAVLEQLPTEYRTRTECRIGLMTCYGHLPWFHPNEVEKNEGFLLKALTEAEEVVRANPMDSNGLDLLARTENSTGAFYLMTNQSDKVEKHFLRAIEIRKNLIAAHPESEKLQAELGEDLLNLGLHYHSIKEVEKATNTFRRAYEMLQPLVDKHPKDDDFGLSLAALCSNWGNLLQRTNPLNALEKCNRAVELADPALSREPQSVIARDRSLNAHGVRAEVLEKLGRMPESLRDWDRVIDLADDSTRPFYRVNRAVSMFRAGRAHQAVAEAHALATNPAISDDQRYNLACILAGSAGAWNEAMPLGHLASVAAAETHAVAAIGILHRLQTIGFFRRTGNTKYLFEDTDLASLRSRSDFQSLLAEMSKKP
jgi:tetratricopeptide (TPR) repeat protein/predicted Ser/Thr protein kinase